MNEWISITEWAEYKKKHKPRLVIFRYAETQTNRPGCHSMSETYQLDFPFGHRICTHFKHIEAYN